MKPKHTPGPWTSNGWHDASGLKTEITCNDNQRKIAEVFSSQPCHADETPEDVANARLIAAAPEMYALLHQIWAITDPSDKTCRIISKLLHEIDAGGAE